MSNIFSCTPTNWGREFYMDDPDIGTMDVGGQHIVYDPVYQTIVCAYVHHFTVHAACCMCTRTDTHICFQHRPGYPAGTVCGRTAIMGNTSNMAVWIRHGWHWVSDFQQERLKKLAAALKGSPNLGIQDPLGLLATRTQTPTAVYGHNCHRCNSRNDYAAANQPNGTYLCFECR